MAVTAAPLKTAERLRVGAPAERHASRRSLTFSAGWLSILALSGAAAAVSLALVPAPPTYDPWSWLLWGREILHGTLSTAGGPSWKPLPVILTTPFALFGAAAPTLWILVARTGAVLAAVLSFRLARRLAGGGAPGLLAGVLAAGALAFSTDFLHQAAQGNSEGLLVLVILLALELQLDGRHRGALVAGALAGLLRPETWLFWGLYALWVGRRDPGTRRLALGLGLGMLAAWLVPEWIGSGNPLRAGVRASEPDRSSLAFAAHPASAVIGTARGALMTWARGGVLAAVVLGGRAASRGRASRSVRLLLWLVATAVAWDMVVALMTWVGFSGNPRYLVGATALFGLAAAAAAGLLARAAAERAPALGVALAVAVLVAAGAETVHRAAHLPAVRDGFAYQLEQRRDLGRMIAAAGGRTQLIGCGRLTVEKFARPLVAWTLDVPLAQVHLLPQSEGYILATRRGAGWRFFPFRQDGDRFLTDTLDWRLRVRGCTAAART